MLYSYKTLLLLLLLSYAARAQKVYEIDSLTNKVNTALPFDEEFVLKIKDPDQSIEQVNLYELFYVNGKPTDTKKVLFVIEKTGKLLDLQTATYFKGHAYVTIEPLSPDQAIEIRLIHKFRGKSLLGLLAVFDSFYEKESDEANEKLDALLERIEPTFNGKPVSAFGGDWLTNVVANGKEVRNNALYVFYLQKIKETYKSIKDYSFVWSPQNLTKANLSIIESHAVSHKLTPGLIANLWVTATQQMEDIMKGYTNPVKSDSKVPEYYDIDKRTANLEKSLDFFHDVKDMVDWLQLKDTANTQLYRNVVGDLEEIISQLQENKDFLEDQQKALLKAIDGNKNIRYTTWFSGSNEIMSLQTRGTKLIIPEIGLVSIFPNGNGPDQIFLRPYAGVSIYFRQINKDIPIKHLKNRILHRYSLNVGLTVIEIKDSEFSDLYNKSSAIFGINYKFNRSFTVSSGVALLNRVNNNPLISDLDPVARFYAGIGFDLDFTKPLNDLTKKIGL